MEGMLRDEIACVSVGAVEEECVGHEGIISQCHHAIVNEAMSTAAIV